MTILVSTPEHGAPVDDRRFLDLEGNAVEERLEQPYRQGHGDDQEEPG